MNRNILKPWAIITVCLIFISASVNGQEEKADEPAAAAKSTVATVDVEEKNFVIYSTFDGNFESTNMAEVKTSFETWTELEIQNILPEGSAVTDNQDVLAFETESLEKALTEAEFALKNSEFALEDAKLDLQELNQTYDLDLANAEREWKHEQEDFAYYQRVTVPQRRADLAYSEKSASYSLEYATDELDQLEKMYTEDELTEESEEIVLKRARRSVESAQRRMDDTMRRIARSREFDNPRADIARNEQFKRQEFAYERLVRTLPIKKQRQTIALAKAQNDFEQKKEKLAELGSDRQQMTLRAPMAGVLYHGRCKRGKWIGATGAPARALEPGKKLGVNKVVCTVVDPTQMMIRCDLDENMLNDVRPGMKGKAIVTAAGRSTVSVVVKSVSRIPLENGKYDCQLDIQGLGNVPNIMPGMKCKVSLLVHSNEAAVVAPKASVFSDDGGVSHYVYLVDKDNVPRRHEIQVGPESGDDIQILAGLKAGDKIAQKKP